MVRLFPTSILVALIFFILFIQLLSLKYHLYFHYWWLDIPMHIMGGIWIALFSLTFYFSSTQIKEKDNSGLFVISMAVSVTLTIGLLWEIYEIATNHAVGETSTGLYDTLKDLVDDGIGALIGAFLFIGGGYNEKS